MALGLLYTGLFSHLEIGPAGVVLRRFGWFWPALGVPLTAVVLDATQMTPFGPVRRAWSNQQLHLGYGPSFDDDKAQLLIVHHGWDHAHALDDEFAWTSLQLVLTQFRAHDCAQPKE